MLHLRSLMILFLHVASMPRPAKGHGHMFWPRARNQPGSNRNGAVGGGPGVVHEFSNGAHTKYQHGICGNVPGDKQSYNRVGDIEATLVAGTTADIKVLITAHHVGYFELELCLDAGQLSETCFMQHRLLRQGCTCACPSDKTNSCSACDECRRWWKPILDGEKHQFVASGYQGPILPGQGNLVAVEFTMQYDIPAGVKTSNGVLRWHYMTTNSCTSKTASPEEFWNCADVAIADADGDTGGSIVFDNAALESLPVENLMPDITSQPPVLTGVNFACPEDSAGRLMGVGSTKEYEGLCGATFANATRERCVIATQGASKICNQPIPASGFFCKEQCGDWFYQCANKVAYLKPVATATKCKDDTFVLEAVCAGFSPTTPTVTIPSADSATTTPAVIVPITTSADSGTTTMVVGDEGIQSGKAVLPLSLSARLLPSLLSACSFFLALLSPHDHAN